MIRERKKWMSYTYFNRHPALEQGTTHLFSLVRKTLPLMIRVPFPTLTVNISEDNFVEHWSKSSRYKINRAEKEGLQITRGNHLLETILQLFSKTAIRKGLRGYKSGDFESKSTYECSAVIHKGIMLCGHVWLIDQQEKRALLFVNASNQNPDPEESSLTGRAHYFLLWQDGLFMRQQGITILDLQGYEPETRNEGLKGVYQWKEATHGRQEMLYHYYPAWFYLLLKFRNMLTR